MSRFNDTSKAISAVILGSVLLGSIGIFVRIAGSTLQPMTQSFGRIFAAFLAITLFNLARKKIKSETLKIGKKDLPLFALNGLVGFSVMAAAFTLSVLYTTITNTYFLLYTAPVFAAVLSVVFLKEKLKTYVPISILVGLAGLVFLFNPTSLTQNLKGNLFGLVTGISFGSYFVITSQLGKRYSSSTITFWTQLFGSLGLFPLIFVFDRPTGFAFSFSDWSPVITAGVIVFLGYWLLNYGLTKIKATTGSILSLFEPLSSIFYGVVFFSEKPTSNTVVGALLILTSIVYLTYKQKEPLTG